MLLSKRLQKLSTSSKKFFLSSVQKIFYGKTYAGKRTDKAPATLGTKSVSQAYVKKESSNSKSYHCMIYRHALASKMLLAPLREVLDQTILMVNFVIGEALNSGLFEQLCTDMDADHNVLFHTNTRRLSRGNATK